ncbi:hypothetical protein [Ekhidna sp.]|uniref:hypothetical protein n=1 Tax=Ekhidna sp. TaxID=2608089 RepID=UPI003296C0A8
MQDTIDLRSLIIGLITSVARSQYEMDRNSIKTAVRLLESGITEQTGLSSHWYAIPEAELAVKMLLEINKDRELRSQMIDAAYTSKYSVDTTLSSDFNLKVKRVPIEEDLNLTVRNEHVLISEISRLRKVAQLLHKYDHAFLNVFFRPFNNHKAYKGGNWYIEVVHPPAENSKQASGLILRALLIVDDESGDIITAKYRED